MPLAALPDADALVLAVIRAGISGIAIGTQMPANLVDHLPYAVAARFGGAAVDPRFLDRATVTVDTWDNTRAGSSALARQIRTVLRDAALNQTTFTEGHIVSFREVSGPFELRTADQADTLWRFNARYSLFLRPAPV